MSRPRIAALEGDRITDITFGNLLNILQALDLDLRVRPLSRKRPTLEELQADEGEVLVIRVWSDNRTAGVLDRIGPKGSTFAYDPQALPERAVSVTMPVRVQSWDMQFGLAPIFEMNLPEGALRERLIRRFAKATGRFDDLDLLSVVGRTQIGRLRFSALDAELDEEVPFQSIDEILRARRGGALFDYLLDTFAAYSGLSGVQPKVMIRAKEAGRKAKASGRNRAAFAAPPISSNYGMRRSFRNWPPMNSSACRRRGRRAFRCPIFSCPRTARRSFSTGSI